MNQKLCPPHLIERLIDYRDNGTPTGDFLRAVLENNLWQAIGRADDENLPRLPDIVAWVYENMPHKAWGSREAVNLHIGTKASQRSVNWAIDRILVTVNPHKTL